MFKVSEEYLRQDEKTYLRLNCKDARITGMCIRGIIIYF